MKKAKLMAVVVVVAAMVLPLSTYLAGQDYGGYQQLSDHLNQLKSYRQSLVTYQNRAEQYKAFTDRVLRFSRQVQAHGLEVQNWSRHDVNINNRDVGYAELARFVEQASSNQKQYFVPRYLKLFRQASVHGTTSGQQSQLPGAMKMSMHGTYLVNVQ